MIIFFVLIGSVAFIFLVIELGKRMARHDNSASRRHFECVSV